MTSHLSDDFTTFGLTLGGVRHDSQGVVTILSYEDSGHRILIKEGLLLSSGSTFMRILGC